MKRESKKEVTAKDLGKVVVSNREFLVGFTCTVFDKICGSTPSFFFGDFEVDFTIFGAKKVAVVSKLELAPKRQRSPG